MVVLGLCQALAWGSAGAQTVPYPSKPIKFVVPITPGGSNDVLARTIAQKLSDQWKQSVVVENRPGGGMNLGSDLVAKSAPDGYTWLLGANNIFVTNPHVGKMPFDVFKDLAPVTTVAIVPFVLAVNANFPAKNVAELVEYAKKNPNALNYGSSGNGSPQQLAAEMLSHVAGIKMQHVPYKGAGPLAADVAGNQIDLGIVTLAAAKPLIESNKVKVFVVSSETRSEFSPNIPAMSETASLANTNIETWYGVFAPIKTPNAILAILEKKLKGVIDNPDLNKNLALQAISINPKPAKELQTYLNKETEKFKSIIQEAHINIQ